MARDRRPRHDACVSMRRAVIVTGAVFAGLLLGGTIDVLRVGGVDAWLAARGPTVIPDIPPYEALGRVVDVDGAGVYLDCRGSGSPTVILEGGFGSGAAGWGETLDGIAAFTRVCGWDRPGLGASEGRGVHSAGESAELLRATLAAAGERGPFVVVAHSFGGVYGRLFAEGARSGDAEDSVLSFLMLDTYEPDLGMDVDPALPPAVRAGIREVLDETASMLAGGETLDWDRTMAELASAGPVGEPAILLTVDPRSRWVDPDPATSALLVEAWYRNMGARYPHGTFEVAERSGHVIQHDRPDLVIAHTRDLVERARAAGGSPNPS